MNAWKEHKNYKMRVFVATKDGSADAVGFYTLTFISWIIDDSVSAKVGAKLNSFREGAAVPAIYLAKLGVCESEKKQGFGARLVSDAFQRCVRIADEAHISTLTLEAIHEERAGWYERLGFERFGPGDLRMAISLSVLRGASNPIPNISPAGAKPDQEEPR